jgi:hypothetical protein
MLHPETGSSFQYSSGDIGIASMSLPLEDFASVGAVIAGSDLAPPRDAFTVAPGPVLG